MLAKSSYCRIAIQVLHLVTFELWSYTCIWSQQNLSHISRMLCELGKAASDFTAVLCVLYPAQIWSRHGLFRANLPYDKDPHLQMFYKRQQKESNGTLVPLAPLIPIKYFP